MLWHEEKAISSPHYNVRRSSIHKNSLALSCGKKKKNCMKVRGGGKEKRSHVQENQPRNSTSTSGKNLRSWPVFSFTYVLTNRWNNILWTYGTSKCLKQKTRNGKGEKIVLQTLHTFVHHLSLALHRRYVKTIWLPTLHNTRAILANNINQLCIKTPCVHTVTIAH